MAAARRRAGSGRGAGGAGAAGACPAPLDRGEARRRGWLAVRCARAAPARVAGARSPYRGSDGSGGCVHGRVRHGVSGSPRRGALPPPRGGERELRDRVVRGGTARGRHASRGRGPARGVGRDGGPPVSTERMRIAADVARTLAASGAVVALETTVVTHGLPAPRGVQVARDMESAVAAAGAVPATIRLLDGHVPVGPTPHEPARLATHPDVPKVNMANFAAGLGAGGTGPTHAR